MPPSYLPLIPGNYGPDVSSYQPNVDWGQVARAGNAFAFVKATESTNYVNPYFAQDWEGIAHAGMVRGTYHFARPDSNSPEAEAEWFLQTVRGPGSLILSSDLYVLDLEDGSGNLHDWCLAYLNYIFGQTGMQALLYSGGPFLTSHGCATPDIAQACMGLWIAAYQSSPPPVPSGFDSIMFWQNTDAASVPGVPGPCDSSIYKP